MFYLMKCPCCGRPRMFHELEQHTIPSLLIDPETGLPVGVSPDGHHAPPSEEATARSRRLPLCQPCLDVLEASGAVNFSVRLKGEQPAVAIASETPLLNDEGQVMAVHCPASGCGALVNLIDGQLEGHFAFGRECHTSGVQVTVGED